ncbi:hypothetical protein PENSTE_c008G04293 [Penicillium steckii]|uniref:Uncharacterized protein n=1 Tax=Penicillium steckii TaxID=303698 RepID=A0A1V6TCX2_9EURO|nr:hypothetical protein PENSTE_c008G04293 [Penicillium steckii]
MPAGLAEHKRTDRKRRTHSKSRRGCRNCKLRRVKAALFKLYKIWGQMYF